MSELAQNAENRQLSDALGKLGREAARLQTLIDTVPSFLWTSFSDGSKEFLNRRWYEYTGLTLEQGKGWGWKVVVHPDDLDRLIREWLALLNDPKPGELETRIRRYDGEYRWFLIRVLPEFDAEGNVVRWLGSDTDIEDRKRAETKLLKDERELRQITDAIPHTIVVLDPKGNPLYANQAMLDYTGLTMQDVLASEFRARTFHPEDLERVGEEREAGFARGLPFEIELRALRKDGRYRGFCSVTTRSATKRGVWCAGMRPEPTSMIASAPKIGHETKTLRCAKTSYAHPCSKKSSVPPSLYVVCWFKFPR